MSDLTAITISLITAFSAISAAGLGALGMYHSSATRRKMDLLEENTNSKMDRFVKAAEALAFERGRQKGTEDAEK